MAGNPRYAQLIDLFDGGRLLNYRSKEIILRAGEEPPGVYLINKGLVKIYAITDHGDENIHAIYKKGEVFPLLWVFTGNSRNVFYESFGPSQLVRLAKSTLLERINQSVHESRLLLDQLASQFNIYTDNIDNLEYTDAGERVVHCLLLLASRFGRRTGRRITIEAPITHQHIAGSVNLARETVSREMSKLESRGLIAHQKRQIVLKDIKGLEKVIGEPVSPNLWGLK